VIGGEDVQDGVGVFRDGDAGGSGNRSRGIAGHRLKQDRSKFHPRFERLLGDQKAILGIGQNDRGRIALTIGNAGQGLLKQAGFSNQINELLGPRGARQGPQPGPLTTGKNDWDDLAHAGVPFRG
jgi:hypothetical protein